ncbi:MAG: hypothetical protein PVJ64_16480, partial [Gemmatimonadales bacterium]
SDPEPSGGADLNVLYPVELGRAGGVGATETHGGLRLDFRERPWGIWTGGDAHAGAVGDRDTTLRLSLARG